LLKRAATRIFRSDEEKVSRKVWLIFTQPFTLRRPKVTVHKYFTQIGLVWKLEFWHNAAMDKTQLIESIRQKFDAVRDVLHERARRIWAASEARHIGWGGESIVEQATGITRKTIRRGLREIEEKPSAQLASHRSRLPGGGRKNSKTIYTDIRQELDALIDPVTRGDPASPLRWACKSIRKLAEELKRRNINICPNVVRGLLHEMGYSLQANRKTREGVDHPDRNTQLEYINEQVNMFLAAGQPVISVDTKRRKTSGISAIKGVSIVPKASRSKRTCTTFQIKNSARRFLTVCMTLRKTKVG
jgi:transposase